MSKFETQCWICPNCYDDHCPDSPCPELSELKEENKVLRDILRKALVNWATKDTNWKLEAERVLETKRK